jgi:beta-lactamase class D
MLNFSTQIAKKILPFLLAISFNNISLALDSSSQCFIAQEKNQIISQEGDCNKRYAPCSTFKIPLSLIGFDSKILKNEELPKWKFKKDYVAFLDKWKQDQTPQSWMKNSCVWYSQVLTKKLGMEKFQNYVNKFNYGNMDLSGDKEKNNGLTNSWLSSSLEISGLEQVAFLEKLLDDELPVSKHSHSMTKNILFIEDLSHGWKLYGKTGSGVLLNQDRTEKTEIQHGWFIGWIERGERKIIFSNHITDEKKEDTFASMRAKADAKEKLISIIDNIESKK